MVTLYHVTFIIGVGAILFTLTSATPLEDYVKAPDDHYSYTLLNKTHGDKYTLHVLNMTSQKWMDDKYSNHPIWWHYVVIVVPTKVKFNDTAFMFIDGGHNTMEIPDETNVWVDVMVLIAVSTQTVVVLVQQVPNEPIVFWSDPERHERKEDAIIAWTWKEFMQNPSQPHYLALMAMTKAAVKAMDTADSYSRQTRQQPIDKFFVAGASKRGWTTWLTSAVDKRVIGMAPIVFDLLNTEMDLIHHYRSLGGWTFAFEDYFEANITSSMGSEGFNRSLLILDPLMYKDRYTMPTYIIKASGDEFFLLDETRFFYNKLTGPHHLRVLPNCEHTMIGQVTNTLLGVRSFYLQLLHEATYPEVSWTMTSSNTSGSIHVSMNMKPLAVTVYQANTLMDGRRDFRLLVRDPNTGGKMFHPVPWYKSQPTKLSPTDYEATVKRPPFGWRAFFIEVLFKGVEDSVLAFTTEVNVVPNTLPFPSCLPTSCLGKLV